MSPQRQAPPSPRSRRYGSSPATNATPTNAPKVAAAERPSSGRGSAASPAYAISGSIRIAVWWLATPVAKASPSRAAWAGPRAPTWDRTATQVSRAAVSTAPDRTSATPLHFQKSGDRPIAAAPTRAATRCRVSRAVARCRTPTVVPPSRADPTDTFHATLAPGSTATSRAPSVV